MLRKTLFFLAVFGLLTWLSGPPAILAQAPAANAASSRPVFFYERTFGANEAAYLADSNHLYLPVVTNAFVAPDRNGRIVASAAGDWFWTADFIPGTLNLTIYESDAQGAAQLWQGSGTVNEGEIVLFDYSLHGVDLLPGHYLVVSDGTNEKGLVLETITIEVFDTQNEIMSGTAPAGRDVWVAAGPQEYQTGVSVIADPGTGFWMADFKTISFDITEEMRTWSYAQIFDVDGDANEANPPPPLWAAAFTYDLPAGTLSDGTYPYHFELEWSLPEPGSFSGQGGEFVISGDAPTYEGYVLLRGPMELRGVESAEGLICEEVAAINPAQPARFLMGMATEEMTYAEAQAHFESMVGKVVWGDGMSAGLVRHEIIPFSWDDLDSWFQYVCTFTRDE